MGSTQPPTNDELRKKYFDEKKAEFELGCRDGNASACFSLGEWYQVIAKNLPKAAEIYDENCYKRKNANSCFNLASLYFSGKLKNNHETIDSKMKKMESDDQRAVYLHEKSCKAGNSQACTAFAQFKLHGVGCKKDVQSAIALLENSCAENDAQACLKLGSLFLRPAESYGMERDPARAHKFIKTGCELGHPNCCQILAVMYRKGDGVEKNEALFEKYKELTKQIIKQTGDRMGVEVV